MKKSPAPKSPIHWSDLQGYSQLAVDATLGVTNLVEAMHHTILRLPMPLGDVNAVPVSGVHAGVYTGLQRSSALVYGAIRQVTSTVGRTLDAALGQLAAPGVPAPAEPSATRSAALSVLNGVLGDHLRARANPLALGMTLRHDGQPLTLDADALSQAIAQPSNKILLLLHGHCMNDLQWRRNGHEHGAALARANGFTAVYLRYNTGLHISENGRCLADLLEQLVQHWPTPVHEISIVGFSMGGLLARSACHYGQQAGHQWVGIVRKLLFVGTPHHGSMVERAGNRVDKALELSPYSHALARLGKIRSAGTTDLRHGNLIDEDWSGKNRFAHADDQRHLIALPANVRCYAIAAVLASKPNKVREQLLGDGLVPLYSALGRHRIKSRSLGLPLQHQRVFHGMHHLGLLGSPAVCAQLQQWLQEA